MSEVEIIVTGKNLAKAAFASASADTDVLKKRTADLAMQLRRSELAAASAGTAAQRAMAQAAASTQAAQKKADDLALALRRSELAAKAAGDASTRAMATAATAANKAAASAKLAADAQEKLAAGEIKAEEAAKADALAQADAAKSTDAAARAALAAERASLAQATAAAKAGESTKAAAAVASASADGEAKAALAVERAQLAQAGAAKKAGEVSEAANSKTSASMEKLRSVGKVALEGLVVGGAAVAVESVKMGMSWQKQMIVLTTSAGESGKLVKDRLVGPIKDVSDGLLKMAGDTGISSDKLAKAMYFVEGASFHAADGLKVMKAAAQGASAENADATTVAKALTDVMVDYHLKASDAADAMSKMMVAVSMGKTNLQDFSAAFASIVPPAAAAGISFNDVAAALSNMTNHGYTTQRASQNLAQALRSLLTPTKPMQKAFDEFGVSADTLKAKLHGPNGLTDAMQYLSDAASKAGKEGTPEYASALKRLMGTAAGANAAISTTGKSLGATNKTIAAMSKTTADANGNVKGFSEVQKTFSTQVGMVVEKVKSWATQLGMNLIPKLSDAMGWLGKHTGVLKVLAGVIGGVLLVAIGAYIVDMGAAAVATIAATWPILAVVAAVGLLVAGVVYAYKHFKGFRDAVNEIAHALKQGWDAAFKEVKKLINDFINGPLKTMQKWLKDLEKWWHDNGAAIMRDVKFYWTLIRTIMTVELTIAFNVLRLILGLLLNLWRFTWGLIWDIIKVTWTAIKGDVIGAAHLIHNTITLILDLIHGHWSKVWGDFNRIVDTALKDVWSTIKGIVSGFGTLLWDAGVNVVKGLIGGIESMVGAVGNTMSGIAKTIRGFLPFSPAKEGPLSGEGSPDKSGAKISSMLATGISSGAPKAAAAMSGVAGAIDHVINSSSGGHHHPHRTRQQIHQAHLRRLANARHRRRGRGGGGGGSGGSAGGGGGGYTGDLTWTANGVQYTVGGAGRSTGGSAAGSTSGTASAGSSGGLQISFDTLHIALELHAEGFSDAELQGLRKAIRIRGGNVQKVLGK